MIEIIKSLIKLYIANLLPIITIMTIIASFGFVMAKLYRDNKLMFQINLALSIITFINYLIALVIVITSIT